jgi:hypothetical protein
MSNNFLSKSYRSLYNVEKCHRASQATDENIIRGIGVEWWIPMDTNTHS